MVREGGFTRSRWWCVPIGEDLERQKPVECCASCTSFLQAALRGDPCYSAGYSERRIVDVGPTDEFPICEVPR
jgi:hypothetical protein